VLEVPVVLHRKVIVPIAVLQDPVVLLNKAPLPIAVLSLPDVLGNKAEHSYCCVVVSCCIIS
jgi:hypothetical protein